MDKQVKHGMDYDKLREEIKNKKPEQRRFLASLEIQKTIKKDAKGHGYEYCSFPNLLENGSRILAKYGLFVTQITSHINVGDKPYNTIETKIFDTFNDKLLDASSIAMHDVSLEQGGKALSISQKVGTMITYYRRYAYCTIIGVQIDKDTDGAVDEQKPAYNKNYSNWKAK